LSDNAAFDDFGDFDLESPAMLEEPGSRREGRFGLPDVVSLLFLALTVIAGLVYLILALNPHLPINPFPPRPMVMPTLFEIPTSTPTIEVMTLPPTWTPSAQPPVAETATPLPTGTGTLEPGASVTPFTPVGPQPTASLFPFTVQDEAVHYIPNPNEEECAWLSIAGQVFGLDGEPIDGLAVQVTGDEGRFSTIVFTGTAPDFGEGAYEVFLDNTPKEAEYQVQLIEPSLGGAPLSEVVIVRTLSSCDKNVALVNFVQNHPY
jgi:hypothetical protein